MVVPLAAVVAAATAAVAVAPAVVPASSAARPATSPSSAPVAAGVVGVHPVSAGKQPHLSGKMLLPLFVWGPWGG